ncbi:MAG: DUF222 domain-containing protein, partial [Vicinamibacterales bacterium]
LRRELSTWVDDDGMVVIRGRLTPEIGAVVQRALDAGADRLFRESAGASSGATMAEDVTFGQRRADALGLLAEIALSADLDRGTAGDRYQVVLHVEANRSTSDASAPGCALRREGMLDVTNGLESRPFDGPLEPLRTRNLTRQVKFRGSQVNYSGPRPLAGAGGPLELADGATYVSAETSRRLTCDAAVVVMRHDASGTVLDVGRKTRTIPPAIRRALFGRDTRCRFPGCSSRRCDAHHLVHWFDGGATRLENLVLLCRRHHRAAHERGFTISQHPDGALAFHRPDGRPLDVAPVLPRWDTESDVRARDDSERGTVHPLDALTAQLAAAGSVISARSVAVWDGTPLNFADELRRRVPLGK